MAKIKLSDYVAKRLKEHNVEHFFMIPGGGAMHLNDSLCHSLPYTVNHHEQACAIAAEGYARVNQNLAVVNVTTGPGGLNCLNGVFGNWTDSVPVLYISGQVKTRTMMESFSNNNLRQLGDQEVDIISVVKPLTKYAVTIKDANKIKYHIDKAIYEATTGRFGPVWINIPIDIQSAIIEEEKLKEFKPPKLTKYNCKINNFYKTLKKYKKPLIIAGHGIRLANQTDNFKKLIDILKIPVVTTFNGMDLLDDNCPYYIGRIGTIGQRAGNFALQNADIIICMGTRNNIRQVSYNWENFAKNAFKIAIDIDNAELNKPLVIPDLKIQANLKDFIPEFIKLLKVNNQQNYDNWLNFCKDLKEKYCFKNHPESKQENKINPYHFTYTLTKCMKENDIMIMANGSACVCAFQNAIIKEGQRYILNSGNASMGYGLPSAIGAYYQAHGRNIICLEGDGSIMMNIQELQTLVHNNLPIKLFVINNNGYSSIRQTQRNFFDGRMSGSGTESGLSVPDFCRISEAFGLKNIKINSPDNMENIINEVLNSESPILCEVITEEEYAFLPKLSSKKLPDGTMQSPSLEDMYPFLDRDEFNRNMNIKL